MLEIFKSAVNFSWAMAVFAWSRVGRMLLPARDASLAQEAAVFEQLARTAAAKVGSQAGGRVAPTASSSPVSMHTAGVKSAGLNTSRMVVLGEGLSAGMGNFGVSSETQKRSFPARIAAQTGAGFSQRLIQPPGIGDAPGFARLPVRIPGAMQTTVVEGFPGPACPGDLSIPGFRLADALERRPAPPLVWRDDARQTAANLILGLRELMTGAAPPYPTQLEFAIACRPTFAIVCLGFYEALEAAVEQDCALLPDADSFGRSMESIITALRDAGAAVLVTSVPDPLDTAHFASLEAAARIAKVERSLLQATYGLQDDDRITPAGLVEIGNQFLSQVAYPLGTGMVLPGGTGHNVSARVAEWNRQIARAAAENDAMFYDLGGLLRCVRTNGVAAAGRRISGDYLGGFYSLNGYYPGETGHAIIANEVLKYLNATCGAECPTVDIRETMRNDPVAMYQYAAGPDWTWADVPRGWPAGGTSPQPATVPDTRAPAASHPELADPVPRRLQLPPRLEQTLPLCQESSYFGEAVRAADCRTPEEAKYGSCAEMLFHGHVMVDSHLSGNLRIRFQPAVNDVSHFEISLPGGLAGDDSALIAPLLYKLPFCQNRVTDIVGMVSSGDMNLATGEVENLNVVCGISTSGLFALAQVNPSFPRQPITFPGLYGSAWARFEQRTDGKLDFSFFGTTFLPLGAELGGRMLRFPLPFSGPAMQFASIPGRGTVMHPHLCLSTKPVDLTLAGTAPALPENTIREYTLFTHNSSFGDHFSLNIAEFGGEGTGRSHLLGRLELQFGKRCGNSIPVAITSLSPGGLLVPLADSPIARSFPGRLILGPFGFDEFLRFPRRTYLLEGVSFLDDPFDVSVGAVDVRTGNLLTDLLHRGFLDQDVLLALIRIEPRTPKSTFYFRGPARFENGPTGQTFFRLLGGVHLPYPPGFAFPQPDLAMAYTVGPNSGLDPFLWLQAVSPEETASQGMAGEAHDVIASIGDRFSYRYRIPSAEGGLAEFEYVNHTQDGSFRMHALSWSSFLRSRAARNGECDAVAFSGFGTWSKDGVTSIQQASVHISTSAEFPYVGVQIEAGAVSNVNTKPRTMDEVRP